MAALARPPTMRPSWSFSWRLPTGPTVPPMIAEPCGGGTRCGDRVAGGRSAGIAMVRLCPAHRAGRKRRGQLSGRGYRSGLRERRADASGHRPARRRQIGAVLRRPGGERESHETPTPAQSRSRRHLGCRLTTGTRQSPVTGAVRTNIGTARGKGNNRFDVEALCVVPRLTYELVTSVMIRPAIR